MESTMKLAIEKVTLFRLLVPFLFWFAHLASAEEEVEVGGDESIQLGEGADVALKEHDAHAHLFAALTKTDESNHTSFYDYLYDDRKQVIEGLGNEVIATVLIATVLVSLIVVSLIRYSNFSWFSHEPPQPASRRLSRQTSATGNGTNGSTTTSVNRRHFGSIDGNCPICLGVFRLPAETNCGHLFCADCLIFNYRHSQLRGQFMRCPVCRQQVTIIFSCFSNTTIPQPSQLPDGEEMPPLSPSLNNPNEAADLILEINDYNRRFSGEPRPWLDYLYDLPTMLRHMSTDFFSLNGLAAMFRVRIVLCLFGAIMYLISPLDMIPEAVFGFFGLLDDIIIVLLLAIYATIIYRSFLLTRWGGPQDVED